MRKIHRPGNGLDQFGRLARWLEVNHHIGKAATLEQCHGKVRKAVGSTNFQQMSNRTASAAETLPVIGN